MNRNPALIGAGLSLDSDAAIGHEAERGARICRSFHDQAAGGEPHIVSYFRALEVAERYGVEPPDGHSWQTKYARLCCERWWMRSLSRLHWRRKENEDRAAGKVFEKGSPYVTQHTLNRWIARKRKNRSFMAELVAVCSETGEIRSMADVADHGLANPAIRRSEVMNRIRGCEELARDRNWRAEFWTLTTPSRFHAQYTWGAQVPSFDGSTPRDARDWLQGVWQRWRAAMGRRGIPYIAMRVAEPHHDGTPHYHILVFVPRQHATEAWKQFAPRALAEQPPVDPDVRCKRIIIRAGESATGYVAAYVSKAIDGEGLDHDLSGIKADEAAKRHTAWASLHGIRQFQFCGTVNIGPWRELRRVKPVEGAIPEKLKAVHEAAREGRFFDYLKAPESRLISILKGEPESGVYGDPVVPVEGIELWGVVLNTRERWDIVPAWTLYSVGLAQCVGPAGIARRDPWTRFNNCTGAENVSSGWGAPPAVARRDFQTERGPP